MNTWKKLAITAVAGMALVAATVGSALADDPSTGTGSPWGRGGGMRGFGMPVIGATVLEDLGITQEEFDAARQAGKDLYDLASEKGIADEQIEEAMLAAKKGQLDKLVAEGQLTQAQADLIYSRMQEQSQEHSGQVGPNRQQGSEGLGMGGRMGGRGRGAMGRGAGTQTSGTPGTGCPWATPQSDSQ